MTPRSSSALTCLETKVSLGFFFFSALGQTVDRHKPLGAVRSRENQVSGVQSWASPELHSPPTLLADPSAPIPSTAHTSLLDSLHRAN